MYVSPCPHSNADNMKYVDLNDVDLIAGVFYIGIL